MEIKVGNTVRFVERGVVKTAEVLRVNGMKLLLMISGHEMCVQPKYKVEKVS